MNKGTPSSLYEAIERGLDESVNNPDLPADHDPIDLIRRHVLDKIAQSMSAGEMGSMSPKQVFEYIKIEEKCHDKIQSQSKIK